MTDFGQRPRQLLKTGQTTPYVTGDDGDLERGLARSYTILTTGQHAGSTDITVNAKTHPLSNNVVNDNSTGLMWARYVPDGNIGPDSNGRLYWEDSVNSEDIFEFVTQANSGSGLGGYDDWRLPNRREMDSLLTNEGAAPFIDTTAFPSTPASHFWTSSTYPAGTSNAWQVRFAYGIVTYGNKTDDKFYCRLVRGGV